MNDNKWIDTFIRVLEEIKEPEKRSLLNMVLLGVINEYKNGVYDGMDGIEILNSFGIKCRHISVADTEANKTKKKKR